MRWDSCNKCLIEVDSTQMDKECMNLHIFVKSRSILKFQIYGIPSHQRLKKRYKYPTNKL